MPTWTSWPENGDTCRACGHSFNFHWITHDGEAQGCRAAHEVEDAKGVKTVDGPCKCAGFTIAWNPKFTLGADLLAEALRLAGVVPHPNGVDPQGGVYAPPTEDDEPYAPPGTVTAQQWERE